MGRESGAGVSQDRGCWFRNPTTTTKMDNNVTVRKPNNKVNIRRIQSMEDILQRRESDLPLHDSDRSVMLDSTMKSLPNTTCLDSSVENELKYQIEILKIELDSAHQEINSLNGDNQKLKQQVQGMSKKIELLLKISKQTTPNLTTTPGTSQNTSSKRHNLKRKLFGNSSTPTSTYNAAKNESPDKERKKSTITTATAMTQTKLLEKNTENVSRFQEEEKEDVREKKKNIYIFGGKQCAGLAVRLSESRQGSNYEKYNITSIVKTGATTAKICDSIYNSKNITENDKIVLSVGEHDTNPMMMKIELSAALKCLENKQVLVLGIHKSDNLNEKKLNNTLKLICKSFQKCKFIEAETKIIHVKNTCIKINAVVDQREYEELIKFQLANRKMINYNTNKSKPLSPKQVNQNNVHKKGTIPYYFTSTNITKTPNPKQNIRQNEKHKKGTIPFYFTKTNKNQTQNIATRSPNCGSSNI